mgnify:CR=1 FL=1
MYIGGVSNATNTGNVMKAILYTRVSTGRQAAEGESLHAQESTLRKYADLHGFTDCELVTDAGISGTTANRPGFRHVMDAVTSGSVDAVIVYSLSRFARNTVTTLKAIETMNSAGIAFHSYSENVDTTSPHGRLFLTMLAAMAQLESEQIGERVSATWQYRKQRGERTSHVPYGKTVAPDGLKLVPNPVTAPVVRRMVTMRKQGVTLQKIADTLTAEKIPNKVGRVHWTPSQIHKLVNRNKGANL